MRLFRHFIKNSSKFILLLYVLTIVILFLSFTVSGNIRLFFNPVSTETVAVNQDQLLFQIITSYVLIFSLSLCSGFLSGRILYNGQLNIRRRMIQRLLYTSFDYFIKNTVGKIWGELLMTTNKVCPFYNAILLLPIDLAEAIVYGVILFQASTVGGCIVLAFIPLIFLTTFYSGKVMTKRSDECLRDYRDVSSWSVETLSMAKMIKTTSSYDFFLDRFTEKHRLFNRSVVKMSTVRGYVDSVQNTIVIIAPLIIVFLSSALGSTQSFSTGNLVILYTFAPLFFTSFRRFYSKLFDFFGVKPNLTAVNDVLSLKAERFGTQTPEGELRVEVRDFSYRVKDKVIKLPNFSINPGDKLVISGESGMGKSTFFNCLTGIYGDFNSSIRINGSDIKTYDLYALRKKILLVNQENGVFTGTLRDNLTMGLSLPEKELQAVIERLKLGELNEREAITADKLSGGEKARINLAQALLRKPAILLIDETLSSVDEGFERETVERLISGYPELTVLYITHRLSVQALFDRVITLE
ncbi:MAG TPA: ATP-binding cassette domain-containing protein [Thermotogota bacterium]|nr:ATP-binding cassette domain-containing protein [Thermotogota bacterium]